MKALYIDDTVDTCDCCGRTDLKATVAMLLEDGGILYYGRTCAARNSGKTQKAIKQEIEYARQARRDEAYDALKATSAYSDLCEKRMELYAKSKGKWPRQWWDEAMATYIKELEIEKQRIAERYRINAWEI